MRTRRSPRLPTFDYLGLYRYFLTFCTHQRRRVFVSNERVDVCLEQIVRIAAGEAFAVSAYCFMPDHLHLLIEALADNSDGRSFIGKAKQASGFHYQRVFGERLWQRFSYERTLRDEDATLSVARYIVENPIRGELVSRVEDYPYFGSTVYTTDQILDACQWAGRRAG